MNRSEFEYLFIHANGLAELALREMASALGEDPADPAGKAPAVSEEERDAQALSLLAGMDMSAMDRVTWEDDKHDAEVQRALEELSAQPAEPLAREEAAPLPCEALADSPESPDLDAYLEKAYASRPQLTPRIDACMARVDQRALDDIVSALPAELPPLNQALTAEGLEQWLAVYHADDDALNALVVLIRSSADGN